MMRISALLLGGTVLLGACTSSDPVFTQFHREAGSVVDTGEFGNATMQNTLRMTGQIEATQSLAPRFASEVPSTITFAFNSAALDSQSRAILSQQANWIRQFPEVRFRVYGHTDLVGSNGYNYNLGLRRARAVVGYLASQGISRSRLEALVSLGETQPLVVTQGRERANRRTVTEVSGFVKRRAHELDGNYAEVIYREYVSSAAPSQTSGASTGAVTLAPTGG
jgi:outer membrane protein OmpA-like peptidoglycan-associated protein